MDVSRLFELNVSPAELMIRGSLMYWFLLLVFRFFLRRDAGGVGLADILLVVLVADASQNGMAAEYRTLGEGFILVGTLLGWNLLLDWGAYHSRTIAKFLEPPPLLIVKDGQYHRRNMRKELLTVEELEGELRKKGIACVNDVKLGYMEGDGAFSFITRSGAGRNAEISATGP